MERKVRDTEWPYSLLDNIIREDGREDIIFTATRDQLDGLNYALSTLYEREYKILLARYHDGKTLEEVAKEYNVTRERIRQVEVKALRKLNHPQRSKYIWHGLYGYSKIQAEQALQMAKEKAEADVAIQHEQSVQKPKRQLTLEEMDLSVRSYNCLKRAGMNYASDLTGIDIDKLYNIRNLGRRSVNEIASKMQELALPFCVEAKANG